MLFFYSKICFTDIFYFSCSIDSLENFHGVGSDTAAGGERGGGGRNSFGLALGDSLRLSIKETSEFTRPSAFPMATMARSSRRNGHARHHEASSTSSSSSSRRFSSWWTSSRARCVVASCRSMSVSVVLDGLDALEQRLVLFTPQQLIHLLLNRRAQPRCCAAATAPRRPRGRTPCESLSGHRGSCTTRQGDSPRLEASDEWAEKHGFGGGRGSGLRW
jgi:hypothetical protein